MKNYMDEYKHNNYESFKAWESTLPDLVTICLIERFGNITLHELYADTDGLDALIFSDPDKEAAAIKFVEDNKNIKIIWNHSTHCKYILK